MKTPSQHLADLAAHEQADGNDLVLRCQDCRGVSHWLEWVEFNSRCPDCGKSRAEIADVLLASKALLVCQDCGAVTPWEDWLNPDAFECCPKCGSHNAKRKRDDQ